jgi:hypothetical protein
MYINETTLGYVRAVAIALTLWLYSERAQTFEDQKCAVAFLLFTGVKNGAMTVDRLE